MEESDLAYPYIMKGWDQDHQYLLMCRGDMIESSRTERRGMIWDVGG
jgi:hypothetical protein